MRSVFPVFFCYARFVGYRDPVEGRICFLGTCVAPSQRDWEEAISDD